MLVVHVSIRGLDGSGDDAKLLTRVQGRTAIHAPGDLA